MRPAVQFFQGNVPFQAIVSNPAHQVRWISHDSGQAFIRGVGLPVPVPGIFAVHQIFFCQSFQFRGVFCLLCWIGFYALYYQAFIHCAKDAAGLYNISALYLQTAAIDIGIFSAVGAVQDQRVEIVPFRLVSVQYCSVCFSQKGFFSCWRIRGIECGQDCRVL